MTQNFFFFVRLEPDFKSISLMSKLFGQTELIPISLFSARSAIVISPNLSDPFLISDFRMG